MSLSRIPEISFQGSSAYFVLRGPGRFLDASPMISMLRTTGLSVFLSLINCCFTVTMLPLKLRLKGLCFAIRL